MSAETKWKTTSISKEPMTTANNNTIDYSELTPSVLPDGLFPQSSSAPTKLKKKRLENPKKIPLFEDLYDPFILDDDLEIGNGLLQEGMNLRTRKLDKSEKALLESNARVKADIDKMKINADKNLDMGGESLKKLRKDTKAKIASLELALKGHKDAVFDYMRDINAEPPPPISRDKFKEQSKQSTALTKERLSKSINQLSYSSKLMFSKLKNSLDLGGEKFKKFMMECKYIYRQFVVNLSQALTQNHATKTEIDMFSSEIIKVITVLLSWLILYNWYYVMFFLEPREQYKLNLTYYEENSSFLYGFLGPPLRAVETVDWVLLEIIPKIKNYVGSKVLIFFIMAVVFLHLVRKGYAEHVTNDFFNAIHSKFTPSLLCLSVVLFIAAYCGMWWWGAKNYKPNPPVEEPEAWWKKGTFNTIVWALLFLVYTVIIIMVGAPIGMLAICGFFFFYSFFAIIMYNGFNLASTFTAVAEDISNISEMNTGEEDACDPAKQTWVSYIYNFVKKTVRYAYVYMFELFMLFILIQGIHKYRVGYSIPFAEKATLKNMNSLGGAMNSAFKHLYTWLIIINTILIVLIVVLMKVKYNNINEVVNLRKATDALQKLKMTPGLK